MWFCNAAYVSVKDLKRNGTHAVSFCLYWVHKLHCLECHSEVFDCLFGDTTSIRQLLTMSASWQLPFVSPLEKKREGAWSMTSSLTFKARLLITHHILLLKKRINTFVSSGFQLRLNTFFKLVTVFSLSSHIGIASINIDKAVFLLVWGSALCRNSKKIDHQCICS